MAGMAPSMKVVGSDRDSTQILYAFECRAFDRRKNRFVADVVIVGAGAEWNLAGRLRDR